MTLIWKRYFLRELAKVFLLFIGCFYFLYVLIDYSAHTKTLHQEGLPFFQVILYYLCQFTKRCDILIPIALMISSIKVLSSLNVRNEITAMVSCGIPTKTLLRPFFTIAFVSIAFLFLNFQYIQPLSLNHLNLFEDNFFKESSKDSSSVNHL
ncbi:MAG: hypothetical protein KR126chlam2_01204, partial [Chlamydiae bacterium]|nr:hypothetical protein [Chlamydiota bacterium]